MARKILLFVTATVLGGLGGMLGSIVGNAGGKRILFVGGFVGGILIAPLTAAIAKRAGWIAPHRTTRTALGAAIGFVLAATIAVNSLSSPIGPVLSTLLIGTGAVLGAGFSESTPQTP